MCSVGLCRLGRQAAGWAFDANWIGGTPNTGWWKNVFGVLTETAFQTRTVVGEEMRSLPARFRRTSVARRRC
jgi:hypothetical protein